MNLGFFLGFIVTFPLVAGESPKYALLGQRVSFYPHANISPQGIKIVWKHDGNKVVEFNGQEEHVYGPYKNRVTLDWHSADLDIVDLKFEDTGEYELEIYRSKILHRSRFNLEVIEQVPMPTVSCEMDDGTSGLQATLTCSAHTTKSHALTGVEWSSHGSSVSWPQPGQNLTILLGDEHDDDVYSCTMKNPLTNQTATFTAKECYDNSSQGALPAVICVAILIAIAVTLAVFLYRWKRKACLAIGRKEDVEKQPPLLNPNGSENNEEWRNSLHKKSTLPSTQPLGRLSQFHQQRSDCEITTHKEMKSEENTRGTKNIDEDQGECKFLLSNTTTLPSPQRLGHMAQFNRNQDYEGETTTEIDEDSDGKSTRESNASPDVLPPNSPSTPDSPTLTPTEGDIEHVEDTVSKKDGDGKSGESDSGLDEEKELESLNDKKELPSISMSSKDTTGREPNDCSAPAAHHQERDQELSDEELYHDSLSTVDQDDTGINPTPNTNDTDLTEPPDVAHAAADDDKVGAPGSDTVSESNADEAVAAQDETKSPKHEDDVILNAAEKTGGESESKEEMETKAASLEGESPSPDPRSDLTTAQEQTPHVTDEDSPQRGREKLRHEGTNDEDGQEKSESTGKRLSSDTSLQAESPTLSKQEDIDFFSESLDVEPHQESRHNSLSNSSADEGASKKEAFIDEKERQCGPGEQRPAKESLCENKEVKNQTEAVE